MRGHMHALVAVWMLVLTWLSTAACTPAPHESAVRPVHEPSVRLAQEPSERLAHDPAQTIDVPSEAIAAQIVEVVDGDTIIVRLLADASFVRDLETVRLLGIDTPEKPGGPRPPECGGDAASVYTAWLLPTDSSVLLAADRETRDQYGRLLAYVFRTTDRLFVNQAIVENGHATTLFYAPNTAMRAPLQQSERTARTARRGFWGDCGGLPYPLSQNDLGPQ